MVRSFPLSPLSRVRRKEQSILTDLLPFFRDQTAEDSLNVSMKEITVTARDGKQSKLETVYIRGSMIRFIVVPDMLEQAPMFKRVGPNAMKGRGIGSARGRATIMRGEWLSLAFLTCTSLIRLPSRLAAQSRRGRGAPRPPPPQGIRR